MQKFLLLLKTLFACELNMKFLMAIFFRFVGGWDFKTIRNIKNKIIFKNSGTKINVYFD